jgi:hypothetical protein
MMSPLFAQPASRMAIAGTSFASESVSATNLPLRRSLAPSNSRILLRLELALATI